MLYKSENHKIIKYLIFTLWILLSCTVIFSWVGDLLYRHVVINLTKTPYYPVIYPAGTNYWSYIFGIIPIIGPIIAKLYFHDKYDDDTIDIKSLYRESLGELELKKLYERSMAQKDGNFSLTYSDRIEREIQKLINTNPDIKIQGINNASINKNFNLPKPPDLEFKPSDEYNAAINN